MSDEREPRAPAVPAGERFLGCLLGLAIGDALGMPVEGWSAERIARAHGWVDGYLPRLDAAGGIVVPAGEFTDDTELALCLVESIVAARGFVDPELAGYSFLRVARGEGGRFLDETTRLALARAEETGDFQAGLSHDPPSAAVAARVAPVGLMHALGRFNPEVFTREVMRAGLITHASPEALNGALAVAYAVRLLVAEEVPPELLIDEVVAFIDEDRVARRLRLAGQLAAQGGDRERDLANLSRLGTSEDVAESVAAALYCFAAHPDDFAAAVLTAVNAGGNSASIAAMAGALSGAHLGARAIPAPLVDGLEGRMYILMAGPGLYQAAQRRAGLFLQLHERR